MDSYNLLVRCHLVDCKLWAYLILEWLADKRGELLHSADLQVINCQNLVAFVEQTHGLWLSRPPRHTDTHTQREVWVFQALCSFWLFYLAYRRKRFSQDCIQSFKNLSACLLLPWAFHFIRGQVPIIVCTWSSASLSMLWKQLWQFSWAFVC